VTFEPDRLRDLEIISNVYNLPLIIEKCSIFYGIAVNQKVLIDAVVHSEHGKIIRSNIKPGSVERSIHHWTI
jgi:hypothetical protein